jgi:hypothetical protein
MTRQDEQAVRKEEHVGQRLIPDPFGSVGSLTG